MTGQTTARGAGGAVETVTVTLENPHIEALPYLYFVDSNGELYGDNVPGAFEVPKNSIVVCFGYASGHHGAPVISGDAEAVTTHIQQYAYFVTGNCTFTI